MHFMHFGTLFTAKVHVLIIEKLKCVPQKLLYTFQSNWIARLKSSVV